MVERNLVRFILSVADSTRPSARFLQADAVDAPCELLRSNCGAGAGESLLVSLGLPGSLGGFESFCVVAFRRAPSKKPALNCFNAVAAGLALFAGRFLTCYDIVTLKRLDRDRPPPLIRP